MSGNDNSKGQSQVPCEDIRDLLFDYMSHELGKARSQLVREHIRRCDECRKQAAEIQSTLDLLSAAGKEETDIPSRLTDERRKKLYWWFTHPVMRWIENHHIIFSLVIAAIILAILTFVLSKAKIVEEEPEVEVFPVWIGDKLPDTTNMVVIPPDQGETSPE